MRRVIIPGEPGAAVAELRRRMKSSARVVAVSCVLLLAGGIAWCVSRDAVGRLGEALMGGVAALLAVRSIDLMLCRRKLGELKKLGAESREDGFP